MAKFFSRITQCCCVSKLRIGDGIEIMMALFLSRFNSGINDNYYYVVSRIINEDDLLILFYTAKEI